MTVESQSICYPDDVIQFFCDEQLTARRDIRIYSHTLDKTVFADSAVLAALSAAVRGSRHCTARIIIADAKALASSAHPLLRLSQNLPSLIKIREHKAEPERYEPHYALLDTQHFAAWDDDQVAQIATEEAAACKERLSFFDQLWEHSTDHPELRSLAL